MKYTDLRKKTAFDFCTDKEAKEWFLDDMDISKEEYLEESRNDDTFRALGLMDVADATDNEALMDAIKKEFKSELDEFFGSEGY